MREILQGCAVSVAITADVWTSMATDSYLTVTAHYLNEQWEIKNIVSGTLPLLDSHTASNLATWIKEMVEDIGEKIVAFVHDNCKNIDNAGKILESEHGWFSLGCAGHTLQLCVNSGLETTAIKNAVSAGRCLTTHFRKSEPALRALRSRQKDMRVESHNLIPDISTRWNSTYYMIDRLVEQRWPLTAVLSDHTVTKSSDRYLDLRSEQWEFLATIKELLHPLQVATTYLSAEYNISVSALYPVLHGLLRSLEPSDDDQPSIRTCKLTISGEIKRRWNLQSLTSNGSSDMFKEVPLMACIVDPRFKKCKFLAAEKHIEIKAALTALVREVKEKHDKQKDDNQVENTNSRPSGEASEPSGSGCQMSQGIATKPSGLAILLGDEYTNNEDTESDQVLNEVESYLQGKPLDREESPLQWWKENSCRFPLISQVAKRYLTVPATSTPAERVFSTAGLTVTRLRASLTPEHVNMLVFLNKNAFY